MQGERLKLFIILILWMSQQEPFIVYGFFLVRVPIQTSFTSSSLSSCSHVWNPTRKNTILSSHHGDTTTTTLEDENGGGIYRPFADYAWKKLIQSNLVEEILLPDALAQNSSPTVTNTKNSNFVNATVQIQVKSASGLTTTTTTTTVRKLNSSSDRRSSIRLGRYALLETMGKDMEEKEYNNNNNNNNKEKQDTSIDNAIHVLNFVIFPNHKDDPLPILGIDLVTLPGMKHLIAIDFQPILAPPQTTIHTTNSTTVQSQNVFPSSLKYKRFEMELERIHKEYVLQYRDVLPWGGDIPPKASRFFSPYALWTRLQGEDGLGIVQTRVFEAFKVYFDLYMEMMIFVDQEQQHDDDDSDEITNKHMILNGTNDYLTYRRENDPARPMLTRLYGPEYTEQLISQVLFEMIES